MAIIIGVILGVLYIVQPIDALRVPVEWLNTNLTAYTGWGAEWLLGFFPDTDLTRFVGLLVAVSTPGLAGLALNLVAPFGRKLRLAFSIGMILLSFGAFGHFPWYQAILISLAATVIGAALTLMSGMLMEAFAAFMSITLGASQVRMLLTDEPSEQLEEMIQMLSQTAGGGDHTIWWGVAVALALVPLAIVGAFLVSRLRPRRMLPVA